MRRTVSRVAIFAACTIATVLYAQQPGQYLPQPKLTTIFPMGAKAGTTVEISVTGSDLDDATGLVFSHPGLRAELILPPAPPMPDPKSKDKAPPPAMKKGRGRSPR